MSTNQETADYIVNQLSGAGDSYARKMFGEYALYFNDKVIGLITDDTLFIKITDEGKAFMGDSYEEGNAYEGARVSMIISEGLISDRNWLVALALITAKNLPLPKKKRKI
ncbi:competence protein TfoX [bacterium]|nr:competence protein TfoX [bacterium]